MGALVQINSGNRFGRWTVLQRTEGSGGKGKKVYYDCLCDCGTIKSVCGTTLRSGAPQSCGCLSKDINSQYKKIDLVGQRFGRLTVLEDTQERANGKVIWKCQCDCGNVVNVRSTYLTSSSTQSCGCLHKDWMHEHFAKDITGQRSGRLTALYPLNERHQGCVVWRCLCDCGKEQNVPINYFTSGDVRSCGCQTRSRGEVKIYEILTENNIPFTTEQTFTSCCFADTGALARFDFFVNNKYLIEYDGEQHFISRNSGWNTEEGLKKIQERDNFKNQWCKENNIPLIRIPYTHLNLLTIEDLKLETSHYII